MKFRASSETCVHRDITAHVEYLRHFMTFDIKGKSLKVKTMNSLTGEVFDAFSLEKEFISRLK